MKPGLKSGMKPVLVRGLRPSSPCGMVPLSHDCCFGLSELWTICTEAWIGLFCPRCGFPGSARRVFLETGEAGPPSRARWEISTQGISTCQQKFADCRRKACREEIGRSAWCRQGFVQKGVQGKRGLSVKRFVYNLGCAFLRRDVANPNVARSSAHRARPSKLTTRKAGIAWPMASPKARVDGEHHVGKPYAGNPHVRISAWGARQ